MGAWPGTVNDGLIRSQPVDEALDQMHRSGRYQQGRDQMIGLGRVLPR